MGSERAVHTAVRLEDGRILIAGGMTDPRSDAPTAELFDPATRAFTPAGAMLERRHSHSATKLPDGTVLIAGGYDTQGAYLARTELYDPARDAFEDGPPMTTARAGHVAVTLADGRVLLIGGVGTGWTFLSSAEIYDPATRRFAPTGAMSVAREGHAAVVLRDGRVLVAGGHTGRRSGMIVHAATELYDPASGVFIPSGDMSVRRHKHDAVLLPDGSVLITGGADERDSRGTYRSTERYQPATGVFTASGLMRYASYKHPGTSVVLADGRVLLSGGAVQAEVFDPIAGLSVPVRANASLTGQFSATAQLGDGSVLVTGGYGEDVGPRARAWLYVPDGR
jgi:hypothetical protein